MNYKKIYSDFIHSRLILNRKKNSDIYFEQHHIIPICCGGTNEKKNLILLTAREHLFAHLLLVHCYEGDLKRKMCFALYMMLKANKHQSDRLTLKQHGLMRFYMSEAQKGEKNSAKNPEVGKKISAALTGRKYTGEELERFKRGAATRIKNGNHKWPEERRKKLSKTKKGVLKSAEHKEKLRQANIGKKQSKQSIEKMFKTKEKNQSWGFKPLRQYSLSGEFIKQWASAKEARFETKIDMRHCLRGKMKTAGGFKWEYL